MHIVFGILLILSGLANIFLIKEGKKLSPEHKPWRHMFEIKFLLALFLTPVANPLLKLFVAPENLDKARINFQFGLICFFYLYSTYIKYFREVVCNNFNDDQVLLKMHELQKSLNEGNERKEE
mmetsp:Transcript_4843/g.3453  ORF Transcript_4843/g.3453 Transcript_4843/m.3453 type:complete len:123 (+) Transcript_4843:151-519(+)